MFSTIVSKSVKSARKTLGLALVLAVCSGAAYASGSSGGSSGGGVPELDPTSLGSAITLLAGGVAMMTDRLRRK